MQLGPRKISGGGIAEEKHTLLASIERSGDIADLVVADIAVQLGAVGQEGAAKLLGLLEVNAIEAIIVASNPILVLVHLIDDGAVQGGACNNCNHKQSNQADNSLHGSGSDGE